MTNWETLDETADEIDVILDDLNVILDDLDMAPPSPNRTSTESPTLPSRTGSPAPDHVPITSSQSQGAWTPTHDPSWTLGPQHHPYVHAAVPYLVAVPSGADWEKLLVGYMTFESLSSDKLVRNLCINPPIPLTNNILEFVKTPNLPTP